MVGVIRGRVGVVGGRGVRVYRDVRGGMLGVVGVHRDVGVG